MKTAGFIIIIIIITIIIIIIVITIILKIMSAGDLKEKCYTEGKMGKFLL